MTPDQPTVRTTARESTPAWTPRPRPPQHAPNIVLIVLDDAGFAHLNCYGSDIDTPNIDRLAAGGLRYNNFHTTSLCSPTRACLLSGRNHHSVGMRFLSNTDLGFSNARGVITPSAATIAEILGAAGYGTYALGKWHLANMEDCTPAGPFEHWPLQRGFQRFYGYLGGATDQFAPELVVDNQLVGPPDTPGYHLSEALVDQAIAMITGHRSATTRPFFTYLAFGATHSPHQAPEAWRAKYRGRYDEGWDVVRARWFERQKQLGIVPPTAELSPRNPGVEAWDALSADQKRLAARMQEAFAAFLDHADAQIGRLLEFLRTLGELDDTLVILLSDNGASQEGGREGTLNELGHFNRIAARTEDMIADLDRVGGPDVYNNYPTGWAQVGNTPLRFYKTTTYEGGVRDPMIVHWPARIAAGGGIRTQYHHVIDVMPTLLECAGLAVPDSFRGVPQMPVEGTSFAYSFADPAAPDRRTTQYYEMLGHRGIYHEGWKAVAMHRPGTSFDDDAWSLYDLRADFAEIHDLAAARPDKLAELKNVWWREAGRFNVLPLDDRTTELFVLRRPGSELARNRLRFLPGTPHLDRFGLPDIRNRSHRIDAQVTLADGDEGALVACGSRIGGHALYLQGGRLHYAYSYLGRLNTVSSERPVGAGEHRLSAVFAKTGEHAGTLTLEIDGTPAGSMPLQLLPWRQTFYGMDVGADRGSTVSDTYAAPFRFTGRLHHVEYTLADDREDVARAARIDARNELKAQ
jgi:arylsulfatase